MYDTVCLKKYILLIKYIVKIVLHDCVSTGQWCLIEEWIIFKKWYLSDLSIHKYIICIFILNASKVIKGVSIFWNLWIVSVFFVSLTLFKDFLSWIFSIYNIQILVVMDKSLKLSKLYFESKSFNLLYLILSFHKCICRWIIKIFVLSYVNGTISYVMG